MKAKNDDAPPADADEEKDELASDVSDQPKVLEVGDVLPNITLKNEKDEDVNVQELAKDNGVVIFLVPKADTREYTLVELGFPSYCVKINCIHYHEVRPFFFLAGLCLSLLPFGTSRFPCHSQRVTP